MEFFEKAKTVRLKSVHGKYIWADEDNYKVYQCKEPMNVLAHWRVERDPESKVIRLKSCHGTYLTASDDDFLLGMTGKKVVQSKPKHIDSSIEWEPIREGRRQLRLKTCHGNFLRANKGIGPPWRNTVTHDIPSRMQKHQDYLLWEVETVWEASMSSNSNGFGSHHGSPTKSPTKLEGHKPYVPSGTVPAASFSNHSLPHSNSMSDDDDAPPRSASSHSPPYSTSSFAQAAASHLAHSAYVSSSPQPSAASALKPEGRTIYYAVATNIQEARRLDGADWPSFIFKGHTLNALKKQLQGVLDIDEDILLCARHHSSNMYQLTLPTLPPKNAPMHIVVVKASASLKRASSGSSAASDDDGSDMDNLL